MKLQASAINLGGVFVRKRNSSIAFKNALAEVNEANEESGRRVLLYFLATAKTLTPKGKRNLLSSQFSNLNK